MKKYLLAVILCLLASVSVRAQSTTVSAQVVDAGGQQWFGGTYQIKFYPAPVNPTGPYNWTGGAFNPGYVYSGILTGTGSFNQTIPSNTAIAPAQTAWVFTVCPAATAACFTSAPITVTGATQNITANLTPPAILINLVNPPGPVRAYQDAEVFGASPGQIYFNLTSQFLRYWNGLLWSNIVTGTGGGGISGCVAGNLVVAGSASTGACSPAIPAANVAQGMAFSVLKYGAIADGSTDNSTAITNAVTALNAITSGYPTLYFPCQAGKQCQYNYTGAGTSPINPLIASAVICDYGVILNYLGSAHAADIGPSGLSAIQSGFPIYRVSGCKWQVTASATDTVWVNPFVQIEFDHNNCTTFVNLNAANWCMETGGFNFWVNVHDNNCTQIGVSANCFHSTDGGDANTQSRYVHNYFGCGPLAMCGAVTGTGIWSDGAGSVIDGNDGGVMAHNIRIGGVNAWQTRVVNNYIETDVGSEPCYEFGDPTDGPGTKIVGIAFVANHCGGHGTGALIGPTTANDLLVGATVTDNKSDALIGPMVTLNQTVGQLRNEASGNICDVTTGLPCYLNTRGLHTTASSAVNPEPWITPDYHDYADSFQYANGTLSGQGGWLRLWNNEDITISTNTATCPNAGPCDVLLSYDLPSNQRNGIVLSTVPTTGWVAVFARISNGSAPNAATSSGYECYYTPGTGLQLYRKDAGAGATQLGGNIAVVPTNGQMLEIEAIGPVISCYLAGAQEISQLDSTYQYGYAVLEISNTTAVVSGFIARGLP